MKIWRVKAKAVSGGTAITVYVGQTLTLKWGISSSPALSSPVFHPIGCGGSFFIFSLGMLYVYGRYDLVLEVKTGAWR